MSTPEVRPRGAVSTYRTKTRQYESPGPLHEMRCSRTWGVEEETALGTDRFRRGDQDE